MVDSILLLVAVGLTFIEASLVVIAFFIGSLCARAKKQEQFTNMTLLASLWATTEAQALKKSTVIQRIIERHHTNAKMTDEQLDEIERQVEEIAGEALVGGATKLAKRHEEFMETYDFDEEVSKDKDVSELV